MKSSSKQFVLAASLICSLVAAPAFAQNASQASTHASRDLSLLTGSVVVGTLSVVAAGSVVTVQAVEQVGESVVVILKGASDAATASVKVAANSVGGVSLFVGQTIQVVAEASGQALYASGKLIAFIPNELGRSLVHHSRVNL